MQNLLDISKFQELDNLEFIARHIVEGFITGLHRSPFHGFSVEFAEHRQYNEGESTKHIDWKLYARTEKLFVKRYEEETNLRCQIVIDTSSSMLFPLNEKGASSKLEFSIYAGAALTYLLRKQRDAVGLTLFSEKLEMHTRSRLSSVHASVMFNELDKLLKKARSQKETEGKKTRTAQTLHQIAETIHKRSLVILFTDMLSPQGENFDEIFAALHHLRYKKHEVILFHVLDHSHEREFSYKNRPYRFIDMETRQEMKFNPNDIRHDYTEKVNAYFHELKIRCKKYNIDFVEVDVQKNFKEVLMPYLIKRRKLF